MNFFNNPSVHIRDKDNVERKISNFSLKNTKIVTDYDATMTKADWEHSWSIFEGTAAFSKGYKKDAKVLFEQYYPLELDNNISPEEKDIIMHKWWNSTLNLFIKHKLHNLHIEEMLSNQHSMEFREWFKEFIEQLYGFSIPVIILSAWVANIIESFLTIQNCLFPNVHIASNRLSFWDDWMCNWFESNFIIHSHNKNSHEINPNIQDITRSKTDIILLGDSLADIEMIPQDKQNTALNIAFVSWKKLNFLPDFINTFDIVIESANDTHNVPNDILTLIAKNW